MAGAVRYFLKSESKALRGSGGPSPCEADRRPVASSTARIWNRPHSLRVVLPAIGAGIGWRHSNRADESNELQFRQQCSGEKQDVQSASGVTAISGGSGFPHPEQR